MIASIHSYNRLIELGLKCGKRKIVGSVPHWILQFTSHLVEAQKTNKYDDVSSKAAQLGGSRHDLPHNDNEIQEAAKQEMIHV